MAIPPDPAGSAADDTVDADGRPVSVGCIVDDYGNGDCGRAEVVRDGWVLFRLYSGQHAGTIIGAPAHQLRVTAGPVPHLPPVEPKPEQTGEVKFTGPDNGAVPLGTPEARAVAAIYLARQATKLHDLFDQLTDATPKGQEDGALEPAAAESFVALATTLWEFARSLAGIADQQTTKWGEVRQ